MVMFSDSSSLAVSMVTFLLKQSAIGTPSCLTDTVLKLLVDFQQQTLKPGANFTEAS